MPKSVYTQPILPEMKSGCIDLNAVLVKRVSTLDGPMPVNLTIEELVWGRMVDIFFEKRGGTGDCSPLLLWFILLLGWWSYGRLDAQHLRQSVLVVGFHLSDEIPNRGYCHPTLIC